MTKSQLLRVAAELCLQEGWAVLPLDPTSKRPFAKKSFAYSTPGRPQFHNGIHGVHSASFGPVREYVVPKTGETLKTTPALACWNAGLECNPAVALGLSGLTVFDIDEGISDENELLEFLAEFHIPTTRAVKSGRTSSFGVHLYFSGAMSFGHFEIAWHGKTVTGEVKSGPRYVAAEGSFHKSGNQYTRLWDRPLTPTPVSLFTHLLTEHSPSQTQLQPVGSDSMGIDAVSRDAFEAWLEKNTETVRYVGFNKRKEAHEYIRVERCPWEEFHDQPNGPNDFAIYVGESGMAVNCVHTSCRKAWKDTSGWKSYRRWLATEKPRTDGTDGRGYGDIPLHEAGRVFIGK
jgi:hypothetical protein